MLKNVAVKDAYVNLSSVLEDAVAGNLSAKVVVSSIQKHRRNRQSPEAEKSLIDSYTFWKTKGQHSAVCGMEY